MKGEIIDKLSALITAAFGLVAALAWNETIKSIFDMFFGKGNTLNAQIIYAIVVTVIAVLATIWIGRVAAKAKDIKVIKKRGSNIQEY